MNLVRTIALVAIPVWIIIAGVVVAVVLVKTGPETPRTEREDRATLVEVRSVQAGRGPSCVSGQVHQTSHRRPPSRSPRLPLEPNRLPSRRRSP